MAFLLLHNYTDFIKMFGGNFKKSIKSFIHFLRFQLLYKEIIPPFLVYLNYHTLSYYIFFLLGSYAPQAPSGLPP